MAKKKQQYVQYVKRSEYRPGVPRRDMSVEEWESLSEAEREICLKLGLYKLVDAEPEAGIGEWPDIVIDNEATEVKDAEG